MKISDKFQLLKLAFFSRKCLVVVLVNPKIGCFEMYYLVAVGRNKYFICLHQFLSMLSILLETNKTML